LPMAGAGIASASWLFLLLSVILTVISRFSVIIEERATTMKFGDTYKKYIAGTPRWIGLPKSGKA
jgi:protein-S-isoprenylcysteine O-methyltransferase Ste14